MRTSALLDQLVSGEPLGESVLLVAAHPDDEIIGVGSRLRYFENLTLVWVTDGAPRDLRDARAHGFENAADYAKERRRELDEALAVAGCEPKRRVDLVLPDQEASLHMPHIAARVADLIREVRPAVVFTHPYEGGHPDHDATAFAVHMGVRQAAVPLELAEFTSYHRAYGRMCTASFLPSADEQIYTVLLTGAEERHKQLMLDSFVTQREMLAAFKTDVERLRLAPAYDFTQPPHPGTLYYEQYSWGMDGERFRELARAALETVNAGAAA
ncbi:MAG TPA: PIG-L family deacetylase [Bryobacteraceae bacterium]|nr:PIG-L family deacetylase [Bryobacteraceae bacterium]